LAQVGEGGRCVPGLSRAEAALLVAMASSHVAGASVYSGIIMMFVSTLSFTGVVMPWWAVFAPGMKGTITLWKQSVMTHVGTGGSAPETHETSIALDEVCSGGSSYFPSNSCHRIWAIRAMVLLALACGLASSGAAFIACGKSWPALLKDSMVLAIGCLLFLVTAIAVAETLETSAESGLDGSGFISIVLGAACSVLGTGLSLYAWRRSVRPQPRHTDVESALEGAMDSTAESKLPRMLGRAGSGSSDSKCEDGEANTGSDAEVGLPRGILSI